MKNCVANLSKNIKLKLASNNLRKLWAFASSEIQHRNTCWCIDVWLVHSNVCVEYERELVIRQKANLKMEVTRKQSTLNFPKKRTISYPLIRTCTSAYQTVRNVCFSDNFSCFTFLLSPFWDSFCFITDDVKHIKSFKTQRSSCYNINITLRSSSKICHIQIPAGFQFPKFMKKRW